MPLDKPRRSVPTQTQTSAGGAVFRQTGKELEVCLISTGDPARWQLPKGIIDSGETSEMAALREVREETGIEARIGPLIERVEYWHQSSYSGSLVRYHKFVHFFVMWQTGGDVSRHDYEVHESRWFSPAEAIATLAFRTERAIVEKALTVAAQAGEPD